MFQNIIDPESNHIRSLEPGGFRDGFEGFRILTVGRLVPQKALEQSVRAMALVLRQTKNVRWYVLGEGVERKNLTALIVSLGLEDRFLLPGVVDNPFPYYRQADLYVHTLGLYIHNFVFWASDMHTTLARSFVTMMSYDMATCLSMFTNISATVIFISRVEMHFHDRYKAFSEAVIGGRGQDIRNTRRRMFRQLADELMGLVRIQFIITVAVFFLCIIILPSLGFGGSTLRIYPCLCVGYFILFFMYAEILFLYYFNELSGALWTASLFCIVTCLGTVLSCRLDDIWFGLGLIAGSLAGFTVGYYRLRFIERTINEHVFCGGALMRRAKGKHPPAKVYDRAELLREKAKKTGGGRSETAQ